jgi:hypothetical protein
MHRGYLVFIKNVVNHQFDQINTILLFFLHGILFMFIKFIYQTCFQEACSVSKKLLTFFLHISSQTS